MAMSKQIEKYPSQMLDLLEAIIERKESTSVPMPSLKAANSERFRFYGLIGAINHNGHSLVEECRRLRFLVRGKDGQADNLPRLCIEYVKEVNASLYSAAAEQLNNPPAINDN